MLANLPVPPFPSLHLQHGCCVSKDEAKLDEDRSPMVEFLADYDYTVHHKPVTVKIVDPLSRRPGLELNGIEVSLYVHQDNAKHVSAGYENLRFLL